MHDGIHQGADVPPAGVDTVDPLPHPPQAATARCNDANDTWVDAASRLTVAADHADLRDPIGATVLPPGREGRVDGPHGADRPRTMDTLA